MDEEERVILADDVPKESSFSGRLQLKNFMFTGANQDASSPSPRRSQRLSTPQLAASTPLGSPSKSKKRKAQPEASEADSDAPSKKPRGKRGTPAGSPKKRARPSSSAYAPPSTYAHLPTLPDAVAPDLLILTIGLNPGLQTARTGHAYAHPSNLYWKLLHSSGITPVRCRAAEDRTMPARYAVGHTNIVARPSRSGAELSRAEMDAGVAALEAKCRRWKPEVACIVGKSIWESVFRVRRRRPLAKGEFAYGWQEGERMGAVEGGGDEEPWEGSRVFVATSTSGLAATVRPEEKERIWKILGDWCVKRRKEREDAAKSVLVEEV